MKWLLRGGQVFDGYRLQQKDLLLDGEVVAAMDTGLAAGDAEVIKADGLVISPGFTDLHVHLRQPGYEQKETIASGTAAAAAGGFTTVCAMPNLRPVPDSVETLQPQREAIKTAARVRVLPYGALSRAQRGQETADIAALAPYVPGYSDDGCDVQSEEVMRRAMREVAKAGRFVAAHCEDESLIEPGAVCVQDGSRFARRQGYVGHSSESEWRAVQRNIRLAEETGCRLHICHTSAKESFELVRQAKQKGLAVTCEVAPHNLLFSCDDIRENSGRYKMNPPLRTPADVEAACRALADGTIDAIATDHAPHTKEEKAGGFAHSANGVVGLETAFAAVYTGLVRTGVITLEGLLQLLGWRPRGVLREPYERIAVGQAVSLVLLDIETERLCDPEDFYTKGRSTPFAMQRMRGWPVMTFYKGEVVYRRGV